MKNIYLHSICPQYEIFDIDETLNKLEKILKTRHLLCRRLLNELDSTKSGFNGLDYISLCDYDSRNNPPYNNNQNYLTYNSYHCYIERSISLIINKNKIKAIKPTLVAPIESISENMTTLGLSKLNRYSDMPDEIQVKGKISLKNLTGITIPTKEIIRMYKDQNTYISIIMELIIGIDDLLRKYGYDKKIYDLETFTELESIEDVRRLTKKLS